MNYSSGGTRSVASGSKLSAECLFDILRHNYYYQCVLKLFQGVLYNMHGFLLVLSAVVLLIGLPIAGIAAFGHDVRTYLEFPPVTRYVEHEPFSWGVFCGLAVFVLCALCPFVVRALRCRTETHPRTRAVTTSFPWWGFAGLALGALAWVFAWTRFSWLAPLQLHSFTPLWIAYIVVVNALTRQRSGSCMLTGRPLLFLTLFPVSAAFWWFFEYLNRFVQNWYYVEVDSFSAAGYAVSASVSFSTVLPAVLGTRDLLLTYPLLQSAFTSWQPVSIRHPRLLGACVFAVSCCCLFLIGIVPNMLYPLVWIAPCLLLVSLQAMFSQATIFQGLARGDWRGIVSAAAAALACGFFWELWNCYSLAKWIYAVPYVHRFRIFEMPLLGFAGYLPFGLECAVVGSAVAGIFRESRMRQEGRAPWRSRNGTHHPVP